MKKFINIPVIIIILLFTVIPLKVSAADVTDAETEISDQVNELLDGYDLDLDFSETAGLTFSEIIDKIKFSLTGRFTLPLRLLGTILIVSVFTSVIGSFSGNLIKNNSSGNMLNIICTLTAAAAISSPLFSLYDRTLETIERTGGFLSVYVPVFAAITASSGGIASGSTYNYFTLAASEFILTISRSYLVPVLNMTVALAYSGSIFGSKTSESLTSMIKKIVTWSMTVAMSLFIGFVTLKSTLSAKADGVASKTARFVLSGAVPIIGGAVSDAYSTVKGSFDLIRTTAGTAGTIGMLLIVLPPIIELLVYRFVFWAAIAVADMLSATSVGSLLKGIDCGLAIAQSVLICYGVIFIFSTAILIQTIS